MQSDKDLINLHLIKIKDQVNTILQTMALSFSSPVDRMVQCVSVEYWQNSRGECGEFVVISNVSPDNKSFLEALSANLRAVGLFRLGIQILTSRQG